MRIIITGANGNLGRHLLKLEGLSVLGISRFNWNVLNDVRPGEFDAVIHTAYDLKKSIHEVPVEALDSNIMSTARILNFCAEKKIKMFGFVSSCAVYGDSSNTFEGRTCQPVTMNGHIKLFNEELVKNFCTKNQIPYQIYRVFNTYGGWDEFSVVQRILKCAREKIVFTLINEGVSERDYIHVEDVANVIGKLIQSDFKNDIINIGSGCSVRVIDILTAVENIYGRMQLLHKQDPNEVIFSRADIRKLKTQIDFNPHRLLNFISSLN